MIKSKINNNGAQEKESERDIGKLVGKSMERKIING